jgi:TMEM175 potassium channel family protein
VSTNRLEAFSDGVIAVAITLLVLDIKVPNPADTSRLGHALADMWPTYAAYVTSFITIGIIWINHHAMISRLRQADHVILTLNLLLLLTIGVLPFATSLMATYLRESQGQHLAASVYAGTLLVMSIAFATLNRHILFRKPHFLRAELPPERRRQILGRSISGLVPYLLATALAPVSSYATLAICAGVAVFYGTPMATGGGAGPDEAPG